MKLISPLLMSCLCAVFLCLLSGVLVAPTRALTDSSNSCVLGLFRLHLTETHWKLLEQKGGFCDHDTVGAPRETQGLRVSAYFFPDSSPPLHVAWSSPSSRLSLTVTSS